MAFLEWLQGTWVGVLVAQSLWGYPLLETIHTIGMAMMIGSLGLINLRVLGYKPELPLLDVRQLLPLAWLLKDSGVPLATICPRLIISILSHVASTSGRMWVDRITDLWTPSFLIRSRISTR